MNIRYFFVADVIARNHIILEYCPTDEMIGDFFTKPVGGAKFRRFRNIIMNISHDEFGPVDVDELMALHNEKIQRRIKMSSHQENISQNELTTNMKEKSAVKSSQECVGDVTSGSKRSNIMWATVRGAHKKSHGRTYAEVTAE